MQHLPSYSVTDGSRVEIGRRVLQVVHETSLRYASLQVLDRSTLRRLCAARMGDAFRVELPRPGLAVVHTVENQSNYGGLYLIALDGCSRIDLIRNPGALPPALAGNLLFVFKDETSAAYGGVNVYRLGDGATSVAKRRSGNPVSWLQTRDGLVRVDTDENQSNYGVRLYFSAIDGRFAGAVSNPAAIDEIRVGDLLFVPLWETRRSYGGVAVIDTRDGSVRYRHRAGDPYRLTLDAGRVVVSCERNRSNHGGDLVLDAATGALLQSTQR